MSGGSSSGSDIAAPLGDDPANLEDVFGLYDLADDGLSSDSLCLDSDSSLIERHMENLKSEKIQVLSGVLLPADLDDPIAAASVSKPKEKSKSKSDSKKRPKAEEVHIEESDSSFNSKSKKPRQNKRSKADLSSSDDVGTGVVQGYSDLKRFADLKSRNLFAIFSRSDWGVWAGRDDKRIRQVLASQIPFAINQLGGLAGWAGTDDERIGQILFSRCPTAIKQLSGLGKWAGKDDERIGRVLASQCSKAISQLSELAEWAGNEDEKIRRILLSRCSPAIKRLSNETLAGYFFRTENEIIKRIGKKRIEKVSKLMNELALKAGVPSGSVFSVSAEAAEESDLEQRLDELTKRDLRRISLRSDWGFWAGHDDARIQRILASRSSSAIQQISDLAKWANNDDRKIGKIISSNCWPAIASLSNEVLAEYFFYTQNEIKGLKQERIREIQKRVDELALQASKASKASKSSKSSMSLSLLAASSSHSQLSAGASGRASRGAFVFAATPSQAKAFQGCLSREGRGGVSGNAS